ncbi:MAG: response regulator [Bernardetiaceae bacterium]|nr:response regulator [Bernardetiaceae bacterium]
MEDANEHIEQNAQADTDLSATIMMVVDDEPDIQLLMKQKFRREIRNNDYKFIFASNGVEAIEKLKAHPEVDVILCDVNMPEMDGITLLSKTRDISPTVQTIIVSAYGDMRNIRRAMNNGAFDFVTKPINFNDLGATISKTIRHVKRLKETLTEKEQLYQQLEKYSKNLEQKVEARTAEIRRQKEVIEAKNQSITESINYAKRIQEATLPRLGEIKTAIPNSFVFYRPRDIVSGDFYWFSETNEKIVITAADCTGHGVPGAFMSLIGNDLLNEIVNARAIYEPDDILRELHKGVQRALRQKENNSRDGMDIALCVVDKDLKKVHFAGAKNSLVYFKDGKMNVIKGEKHGIGGAQFDADRVFRKHVVSLEEGPLMIYIYSDGYQDQFGGEKGSKYMSKNFKQLLTDIHEAPLDEQAEKLEQEWLKWRGSYPQVDDILIVGMRLP